MKSFLNGKYRLESDSDQSEHCRYSPDSEIDARYYDFYMMMHVWLCEDFMYALEIMKDPKASEQEITEAEDLAERCLTRFLSDNFEEFCDRINRGVDEVVNALIKRADNPGRRRLPGLSMLEKDEYFHA